MNRQQEQYKKIIEDSPARNLIIEKIVKGYTLKQAIITAQDEYIREMSKKSKK